MFSPRQGAKQKIKIEIVKVKSKHIIYPPRKTKKSWKPNLARGSIEVGSGGAWVTLAGGRAVTGKTGLPRALEVLGDGEIVGAIPVTERRNLPAPFLGIAVVPTILLESDHQKRIFSSKIKTQKKDEEARTMEF